MKTELLETTAEKPLLERSLESLHRQSGLWLSMTDFWKDEVAFFSDLIWRKLFRYVSSSERSMLAETLEVLAGTDMEALRKVIITHEASLFRILAGKSADRDYREQHLRLGQRVEDIERRFMALRKLVFRIGTMAGRNFYNGNETLQTIHERRSVRKYLSEPVDHHLVHQLLDAAAMAPSAMNAQPWKFYVLTDHVRIAYYAAAIRKEIEMINPDLLRTMDEHDDPVFYNAPLVVFITGPVRNEWVGIDVGFCAQNLMLAAKSLGYDSCPVDLAVFLEKSDVYSEMGIPGEERVMLAVVIGRAAELPLAPERKTGSVRYIL